MDAKDHRSSPRYSWIVALLTVVLLSGCGSSATTAPTSASPGASDVPPPVATAPLAGATTTPVETSVPIPSPTVLPTGTPTAASTAPPPPLGTSVVVGPGDTLWAIAQRYDRTVKELLAANPRITDRSLIRVGDKIAIPSDDAHALWNATLDLPALPWQSAAGLLPGCLQGRLTFVDGSVFPPRAERNWWNSTWIEGVVRADVDRDGTTDLVALIKCQPSQGSFDRVVAFRVRADGTFATIGLVLQEDWWGDVDNEIASVCGIDATPSGEVLVGVGDNATTYTDPVGGAAGLYQQRTYGWDGRAFVQTAGPPSFLVPPGTYDLSVNASPMTYAKPVNGMRAGTMTVTVRNNGATAVEDLSVLLAGMEMIACADAGADPGPTCTIGRLAPGATRSVTFHHSSPGCELGSSPCMPGKDPNTLVNEMADLQVRIGDQKYSEIRGVPVVFK